MNISFEMLDEKSSEDLSEDHITLDVGIKELLLPWQHSLATAVNSFILVVTTC